MEKSVFFCVEYEFVGNTGVPAWRRPTFHSNNTP